MNKEKIFHKYPKIKLLGNDENKDMLLNSEDNIIIEEKIDGANFRFMIKDNRIIFGSRTQSIGDDKQEIGGNWKRCVEFIKERLLRREIKNVEGYIYYGECCIKHTLDYDWEKIPPFLGFDVFSFKSNKFLSNKNKLFEKIDLPIVPHIKTVKASEIKKLTDKDVPISYYANPSNKDKQAEGIVLKNYNNQIFAKYVREKFREENRDTFGGSKKWASNDTDKIIAMYCTNARIDKMIFKLIDEGHKLELPMMHILPKKVTEDICEEHWKDICYSRYKIDFNNLKNGISKRCFNVLKQVITNNMLQNENNK